MWNPQQRQDVARDRALETQLARALDGARIGRVLYGFCQVDSTMEIAHTLAQGGAEEGTLIWAARQSRGRGRLGRSWRSPTGGVYCSAILRPSRPADEIPQLSLVTGLACVEAIQETTGLHPSIRWPNDLLIDGRKVAGILVESSRFSAPVPRAPCPVPPVVVGIGVNVTTDPKDLPEHATSLAAAGASIDLFHFTGAVCRHLDTWYDVWAREGFAPIRQALRSWIGIFGQVVHIAAGSDQLEGTASDLDERGRLLVRLDSGLVRSFDMGEVTLLK